MKAKTEKRDRIMLEREARAVQVSHDTAVDVLGEVCLRLRQAGMKEENIVLRQVELQSQVAEDRDDMIELTDAIRKASVYMLSRQKDDNMPGRDKIAVTLDELVDNLEWQLNAESVKCMPAIMVKCVVNVMSACQDCLKNEHPVIQAVRAKLLGLVNHPRFGLTIYAAILGNSVTMATEGTPVPEAFRNSANTGFAFFFALEMLVKMLAMGFMGYLADSLNQFDAFIVATSLLDVMTGGGGAFAVLRAFRLMRVLKLARFMPSLRKQLEVIGKSIGGARDFTVVLLLFIFIFAVLGMYLFGGRFGFEDRGPYKSSDQYWKSERANFDDPY